MSVVFYDVSELAPVVALLAGELPMEHNREVYHRAAEEVAAYSRANCAAFRKSYPHAIAEAPIYTPYMLAEAARALTIYEFNAARTMTGPVASWATLATYNLHAQDGTDFVTAAAQSVIIRALTTLVRLAKSREEAKNGG